MTRECTEKEGRRFLCHTQTEPAAPACAHPHWGGPDRSGQLRCFGGDRAHPETRRRKRVIATVVMMIAGCPFLLDVRDLTVRRELPVMTGHATAREIREAEETNKTHHPEILCRC